MSFRGFFRGFEGLLREGMIPPAGRMVLPYLTHSDLNDSEGAAIAFYLRTNSQRSVPTPTMVAMGNRTVIVAIPDGEEVFPALKYIFIEDVLRRFPDLCWGSWESRCEYAFIRTLGLTPVGKNGLATLDPNADVPPVVHTPPPPPPVQLPTRQRFVDCANRRNWGYEIISPTEYVIFYGSFDAKPREIKKSFPSTAQMVSDITKRVADKVQKGAYTPI